MLGSGPKTKCWGQAPRSNLSAGARPRDKVSFRNLVLGSGPMGDGQSVISFNPAAVKVSPNVLEQITIRCLSNMSFFAARNQVNCTLSFIDDARDWMKNSLMPKR